MKEYIKKRIHELYWNEDINCVRTTIICLCELFKVSIEPQTLCSAVGLHGAGGYRAQCGLVEGALMFIGIYLENIPKNRCGEKMKRIEIEESSFPDCSFNVITVCQCFWYFNMDGFKKGFNHKYIVAEGKSKDELYYFAVG